MEHQLISKLFGIGHQITEYLNKGAHGCITDDNRSRTPGVGSVDHPNEPPAVYILIEPQLTAERENLPLSIFKRDVTAESATEIPNVFGHESRAFDDIVFASFCCEIAERLGSPLKCPLVSKHPAFPGHHANGFYAVVRLGATIIPVPEWTGPGLDS
jgi:hypothetical protein